MPISTDFIQNKRNGIHPDVFKIQGLQQSNTS